MIRLLQSLSLAFTVVGWIATPVATIWLLVLRQWWVPVVVVAVLVVAPLLLSAALIPALGLAAASAKVASKSRTVGLALGFAGLLYVAALITIWCMTAFMLLIERAPVGGLFPILLLVFAVGAGPWKRMARHELRAGRRGELVQTFFLQLALGLVLVTYAVVQPEQFRALWWLFGFVMLAEVVAYMWPAFFAERDTPVTAPRQTP